MTDKAKKLLMLYEQSGKRKTLKSVPPLTFKGYGKDLKNYRIYGNTVNGESVGNLVTDSQSEHYGEYAIPITNNSETSTIYLDEPLRKVGDEAEYVDYATQKWHRVRKNLCPYESTNNTIIGHVKQGKTYTFSFYALYECGFNLIKRNADSGQTPKIIFRRNCNGNVEVTFQADENFDLYFNGYSSTTGKIVIDCVSKLQLEESSAATSYEPYIENTEVDVTLPEIAVTAGTNILSVGTTVQPSKVEITGKIKQI